MSTSSLSAERKLAGNAKLLRTGEYADFIISSGDVEFRVHRSIVCPRSQPIKDLIDGKAVFNSIATVKMSNELVKEKGEEDLKLDTNDEDKEKTRPNKRTKLADDDLLTIQLYDEPAYVQRIIQWIYTDDYNDSLKVIDAQAAPSSTARSNSRPSNVLIVNARMLILASQYGLAGLPELATQKYDTALGIEGLTVSFVESLKLIFQTKFPSDHLIKTRAIKYAALSYPVLVKQSTFKTLLQNDGRMGLHILEVAAKQSPAQCSKCEEDQNTASRPPRLMKESRKKGFNHYCFGCNSKF